MNYRFTDKKGRIIYWWHKRNDPVENEYKQDLANQKLMHLEDIEEELGIDLVTLFKALTSTVYLYHNGELTECEQAPCLLCFDNEYCLEYHFEYDIEQVYLKDYGKTWALTKEELL